MRDSGKDRVDEIKIKKLKEFPFFTQEDYNELKPFTFMTTDLHNGQEQGSRSGRNTIGCFGGRGSISPLAICS